MLHTLLTRPLFLFTLTAMLFATYTVVHEEVAYTEPPPQTFYVGSLSSART